MEGEYHFLGNAVVAAVGFFTFGMSVAVTAAVMGGIGILSVVASDIQRGEVSNLGTYLKVAGGGFNATCYNLSEFCYGRTPTLEGTIKAFEHGVMFTGGAMVVSKFIPPALGKVNDFLKGSSPATETPAIEGLGKADTISKALNDSKTALTEHLEYIKNGGIVKSTGGKFAPSKVSAAINTQTGEIYYGYSGKTGFNPSRADVLDEGLQTLVDNTKKIAKNTPNNPYADRESFELWPVDNCAEINAVDQALKNGGKREDIFIRTVNFKTGEFAEFYDNYKVTFKEFMKATE